jgi:hypothetical protein
MSIKSKGKTKKRKPSDSRITLVAQHKKKIKDINKLEDSLPSLEKELKKLKKEKELLLNSNNGLGFITSVNGKKIYNLNVRIKRIEKNIRDIKNNNLKNNYYSKTAHILYKYYDNVKNVSQRHKNSSSLTDCFDNLKIKNESKKKTVIDFLFKKSSKNITDTSDKKEKMSRSELLDSYTKIIHPKKYKPSKKSKKTEIDICKICNIEMKLIQSEGIIVCTQCGNEEHILIDSDKPSYKDPPPEAGEFTYKRINRFDEWLTQYQAKETTEIPLEVLDKILLEIKKEGITNLCKLTMERVRGYLKRLGLNKYYEHIPHIIYCLNGLPTPRLTIEIEEKLRAMFRQIQDIFDKVCPDNRTNFLSYSYLLRKLLELLGEDEHKKYFRLHKSREKIYQHDKVWQKICKLLGWQYIRTV